jgi:hypothetical protein
MRALIAALLAALAPRASPAQPIDCHFRVMIWDVGVATLKSDRYFAIVDLAQMDFGVRIGLAGHFLKRGVRWVNLAQSARFERPLRLFQRYTVTTAVVCTDDKHAYLSHRFTSPQGTHAEVLVKLKFKIGSRTVPPHELLGQHSSDKSPAIVALDTIGSVPAARKP